MTVDFYLRQFILNCRHRGVLFIKIIRGEVSMREVAAEFKELFAVSRSMLILRGLIFLLLGVLAVRHGL